MLAPALALLPVALAVGDTIQVTVVMDDRARVLTGETRLQVDQAGVTPVPFLDDGTQPGDAPGDQIQVATVEVRRTEALTLQVVSAGRVLGSFPVFLPSAEAVAFTVRSRRGTPPLLLDLAAEVPRLVATPQVPIKDVPIASVPVMDVPVADVPVKDIPIADVPVADVPTADVPITDVPTPEGATTATAATTPLVVVAAPATTAASAAVAADSILVRVTLDDRTAHRLTAPRVAPAQDGVAPVPATDDGSADQDTAGDAVFTASVTVKRTQYLAFRVLDGDAEVGAATVFLPSTSGATVALRTLEGTPAITLDTTAQPGATPDAAAVGGPAPAAASSTGSGGSCDRFSATLWLLVGVALAGFAWVRTVVRRVWLGEIRPFVQRMEAFMERQGPPPGPGAGPPA